MDGSGTLSADEFRPEGQAMEKFLLSVFEVGTF